MNNYKLIIQYDGTEYSGWQIQNNAKTIQGELKKAIDLVLSEDINIIGSGRTDSGVHSFGQTANFISEKTLDLSKFKLSINSLTKKDIFIESVEFADEKFHSRFDAKKRSYVYFFSKELSPFAYKFTYNYPPIFNYSLMELNNISRQIIGKFDFTSFSKKNEELENKFCTIYESRWRFFKNTLIYYIQADRFLHGMVRTIAGTIINIIKNKNNNLLNILDQKNRDAAGTSVPANGLFLYKVRY